MAARVLIGMMRASLRAAVVLSAAVALFLLFLLWTLLQLFESPQ